LNIGFDLDETLVDLHELIQEILIKYNLQNVLYDWKFSQIPENIRQEIYEMFKSDKMYNDIKVIAGVKNILRRLKRFNKLYLITARNISIKEETIQFINDTFFSEIFEEIIIVCNESKEKYFREFKLDYWIDDNPDDLQIAKDLGIRTIMISNENTCYNWSYRDKFNYIDSVGSYEILDMI
jgi:uncharacterized HAD superfamily protein